VVVVPQVLEKSAVSLTPALLSFIFSLRLKTSALDKFRLPIDVKEGYLGDLTLSIPWSNLKGKPVRVLIENVHLLAAPKNASAEVDEAEEEERAQAAKQEKLANAELLGRDSGASVGAMSDEEAQKNESFTSSLVTKIVDNLQITVRNIHVRYEDKLSNPEHPFSAGFTLSEFSAVSTDGDWNPTFIQNSTDGIHKLARLESLSLYWDTDSVSLAGFDPTTSQKKFSELIPRDGQDPSHQYILKPVSGAGRLVMRRKMTPEVAKMDAQLLFDELGFALDDEQYRDVISVADLFHFYTRQAQYRKFRASPKELERNRPRALFKFAGRAIINEVHEKHRVWTWEYFKQRRDDRKAYVELFKHKDEQQAKQNQKQASVQPTSSEEGEKLRELEQRLSYKDIRFYRSIARNELRKERAAKKKEEAEHGTVQKAAATGGSWLGWIWGGATHDQKQGDGVLNEEQRKELYDAIEWDESMGNKSISDAVDAPGDAIQMRLTTKLQTGSFALKDHSRGTNILALVFDSLQADVVQRVDNLEAALSLGGLRVYDGTTPNSLYPQIVRVKDDDLTAPERQLSDGSEDIKEIERQVGTESDPENPFFFLKFENKPLDKRADNALTVKMRSMEIIYHRGYVESIFRFFRPPESELELIGALIDVASETLEGIRKETRAGLEAALENHKTIDVVLDISAPIIIIPEDVTARKCQHVVLDAGHIGVRSVLAPQEAIDAVRSKTSKQYTDSDYKQLEDLMYDRFFVKLESAQLVMGNDLESCLRSLEGSTTMDHNLHLLERINLNFTVHNSILPSAPNLTKVKVTGHLPTLRVNFSDRKYHQLMAVVDVAIPNFDDEDEQDGASPRITRIEDIPEADTSGADERRRSLSRSGEKRAAKLGNETEALDLNKERRSRIASQMRGEDDYLVDDDDDDSFEDAEDVKTDHINAHQKNFELNFVVDQLQASIFKSNADISKPDRLLVEATFEGFFFGLAVLPYQLNVDVGLRSLQLEDKIVDHGPAFKYLLTSKTVDDGQSVGGAKTHGKDSKEADGQSTPTSSKDLVKVQYIRVQPDSPEFMSVYEGIDQSINVELSTINIMLTRVSILAVYDWIMTTFVPHEEPQKQQQASRAEAGPQGKGPTEEHSKERSGQEVSSDNEPRKEKLRIRVKLTSVVLRLNNDGTLLSTLTLSTADVAVFLRGATLRVAARLGSLLLLDNTQRDTAAPEFKKLLSIEGDELADFSYETFDPEDSASYPGYDSSIWLRSGSLRFTFMEEPIRDLLIFFSKFARMKAVYDAATEAATAQATQLQERASKMHYDVIIQSPVVVLPRDASSSDVLVANLGEIYAHNTFPPKDEGHVVTKVEAGLRHIRLASRLRHDGQSYNVQMIDDVNISVDMTQEQHLDHNNESDEPEMQIIARMSDVQIKMTQHQYCFIMALTQSIPRAFAIDFGDDDAEDITEAVSAVPSGPTTPTPQDSKSGSGSPIQRSGPDMLPELGTVSHQANGESKVLSTALDLLFSVRTINLEIFTAAATGQDSLYKASLARFTLSNTEVKLKMLSDSSLEAELALKAFTVSDTRPDKDTKFREIIPASRHVGHQLMVSFTMSGDPTDKSGLALITVDSPKMIFALDPLFALLEYATSPFQDEPGSAGDDASLAPSKQPQPASRVPSTAVSKAPSAPTPAPPQKQPAESSPSPEAGGISFRVNVVDPSVLLLASPEKADSEVIVLSIKQVLLSQQGILALKVDSMGMFVTRMSRPRDSSLRLLDNFDLALSMDTRSSASRQMTSIEIDIEPIVLRVSYGDILLLSSVVNKAIELSARTSDDSAAKQARGPPSSAAGSSVAAPASTHMARAGSATKSIEPPPEAGKSTKSYEAELIISKEVLKAEVAGVQVVLIGDIHTLPLLDLSIEKFTVDVRDWTGDMQANAQLATHINYYNLSRSHWEPLIEPWVVELAMQNSSSPASTHMTISSKRRLEVNVTTTLIETALTSMAILGDPSNYTSSSRQHQAPFKIRNRTGYRLGLCAEHDDRKVKATPQYLDDSSDMPFSFSDWKSMRENITETGGRRLALDFEGMPWDRLKHISVDREGEFVYNLRPKLDKVAHRVVCDIKLEDNVKVITFRSSFVVENSTMVPVEMMILDKDGRHTDKTRRIAPGESCPVPIEDAFHHKIRLRPDRGFDYQWSNDSVGWQDLMKRTTRSISCKASEPNEAPFRFQCFSDYDKQDPMSRQYPKLTLRLRPPVEIENLLPYDIQYRIFDKNMNHNWSSFLRKGGVSPIHVVELSHLLLLSADIQSSVFSPSEFAIIATDNPDDFPVEKDLTLADSENLKLNLRLHYFKYPDSGGAFKVSIYSPYIFINQTGLPFSLKTKSWLGAAKLVAGQDSGPVSSLRKEPMPFVFSHSSNDRRNRMLLRVGDSGWSKPLSFEAIGSEMEVVLPSASKNEEIHLGLTISDGLGKFKLSKVVKLRPRYIVRNQLNESINLREAGAADFVTSEANTRLPLHFLRVGATKQMTLAWPGLNNKWTAPFNVEDVGTVHLRIAKAGHHQQLVKAEVLPEGPTVFITLSYETGPWPFMMRNESDYTITFSQTAERTESDGQMAYEQVGKRYELKPRSKMKFAWDFPSQKSKLIKLIANGRERNLNPLEIGSQLPFKFPAADGRGNRVVSIDVRLDGPTQTVVLSNYSEALSNYKIKRPNLSRSDTMNSRSSTEMGFEAVDIDTDIVSSFGLILSGVGISLMDRRVQEIAYISLSDVDVRYNESQATRTYGLTIKWMQIDNQLWGALFPISLYPANLPKDKAALETLPTLQVAVVEAKDETHGVRHLKYASVLLQELQIEIELEWLMVLLDFSKAFERALPVEAEGDYTDSPTEIPDPQRIEIKQADIYIELLLLQPLFLTISFLMSDRGERNAEDQVAQSRSPLAFLVGAVTSAVGNLNQAPIRLSAIAIENARLSPDELVARLQAHYVSSAVGQVYKLVGAIDVLGNPLGLISGIGSGVSDLLYSPIEGLVLHGNRELGLSIARGAGSFVRKTVFGVSDSISKFTSSVGSGLAAASLDKDFEAKRRAARFRNKPRHALTGVTAGANSFFSSLTSAVEGVALRPLEGAERGGALGFSRGIGKGGVGLLVKPAVGAFDLAASFGEGIKNTTTVFDSTNDIDRVRLPRYVAPDLIVRPYSSRESLGLAWLKNLEESKYVKEYYVAHADIGTKDEVVMLTTTKILYIRTMQLKCVWEVGLSELSSVSLETDGIALILRSGAAGPFLKLKDVGLRNWLFKHISRVVTAYNQANR
jgi:vacuolar protein sorting-associated protein 13A/C